MYYKIPLGTDLTNINYRCSKETKKAIYIEYNSGIIEKTWEEINEETVREIAPEWFAQPKPEPTQLDRIESALSILTADTVTTESIDTAISEGVNEV